MEPSPQIIYHSACSCAWDLRHIVVTNRCLAPELAVGFLLASIDLDTIAQKRFLFESSDASAREPTRPVKFANALSVSQKTGNAHKGDDKPLQRAALLRLIDRCWLHPEESLRADGFRRQSRVGWARKRMYVFERVSFLWSADDGLVRGHLLSKLALSAAFLEKVCVVDP